MTYNRDYTPDYITELQPNEIFVFGSNIRGMHGGGAAYIASRKFRAEWGVGEGLTGQCYALPQQNISYHLLQIEESGELHLSDAYKKILLPSDKWSGEVLMYNLDRQWSHYSPAS